jgi:hypothetical protein
MCRHGILIAFWFLGEPESPKTFFDFIVGRYKTAPRMVVYDHSCGLSAYALNRIPLFFRNTRFRIDKFHWRNHIACSEAFDFSSYCKSNPKEYDLNTNEVKFVSSPLYPAFFYHVTHPCRLAPTFPLG